MRDRILSIDVDNTNQIDGLCKALVESMWRAGDRSSAAQGIHPSTVVDALIHLITPKPAEPTGIGAVVEDANGNLWTRADNGALPWFRTGAPLGVPEWATWDEIDAAIVLNEGVRG